MLRGIQVLAVSRETVVSKTEEDQTTKNRSSGTRVTFLVTTKQAEALSLAQMKGDLSLTIRKPNDKRDILEKNET
jgi:Flp pilus assembly protein CpaB